MPLTSSIYNRLPAKQTTAIKRFNTIVMKRKLRLASFVPAPRLVKGFHNRIEVKQ